jgi:hypothetical protein
MNKRSLRILGLILMIFTTLLPVIVVLAFTNLSTITGQASEYLIIAKRSILDKKIPYINTNKLTQYNQVGCGEPQFPTNKTRFYMEEKVIPTQDPILDFFEDTLQSKSCYFNASPSYYLLDPSTSILQPLTLEQVQSYTIDTSIIESIKGKPSLNKPTYQFNTKNNNYTVYSNKIEVINNTLGLAKQQTYNLSSPEENTNPIFQFNLTNLEVLGTKK